jgi:hypothetical protein
MKIAKPDPTNNGTKSVIKIPMSVHLLWRLNRNTDKNAIPVAVAVAVNVVVQDECVNSRAAAVLSRLKRAERVKLLRSERRPFVRMLLGVSMDWREDCPCECV